MQDFLIFEIVYMAKHNYITFACHCETLEITKLFAYLTSNVHIPE